MRMTVKRTPTGVSSAIPLLVLVFYFVGIGQAYAADAVDGNDSGHTVQVNDRKIELVHMAAGQFQMGREIAGAVASTLLNWEAAPGVDEGPPRQVTLTKGFSLGRYEVTCELFCEFLNAQDNADQFVMLNQFSRIEKKDGGFQPKEGCAKSAVNVVHWTGAVAFCKWLSEVTGMTFRLPTEAEWEYAARGKQGRRYPWGNERRAGKMRTDDLSLRCLSVEAIEDVTPEGIVGMGSGVWEWCSDFYGVSYLPSDTVDPKGPKREDLPVPSSNPLIATVKGEYHVLRGGSPFATRRKFGNAVKDAGIYGVRVVMETGQ